VVTFVLDASAIFRYLDAEEGKLRVAEVLKGCLAGRHSAAISSMQWGEVAYLLHKRHGARQAEATLDDLLASGIEVVAANADRAVRAGIIKATRRIPYADAFGVELAGDSPDHILMTAGFDVKAAENDVRIEFLPTKSKPN
jgi:PIN domain nuclease of toxin-antitoxin system